VEGHNKYTLYEPNSRAYVVHMCNAIMEKWEPIIIQAVYTKNGNISVKT
jgi:hypothetical protein